MIPIISPNIGIIIDRWLWAEKKILIWEKQALNGNITATSNLIIYNIDTLEKEKWLKLYNKQKKSL